MSYNFAPDIKLYSAKDNLFDILLLLLIGKRPLGRPRRIWVDNIKMDLGEIG
jgi:hypothetical protein